MLQLSIGEAAQLLAATGFLGGAFYWGGQIKAMVTELRNGHVDHEHRIRVLEGTEDKGASKP